jgi:hypothetical protein
MFPVAQRNGAGDGCVRAVAAGWTGSRVWGRTTLVGPGWSATGAWTSYAPVLESEGIDVTKFESVVDAQRLERESVNNWKKSVNSWKSGRSLLPRVKLGSDGWPRLYA